MRVVSGAGVMRVVSGCVVTRNGAATGVPANEGGGWPCAAVHQRQPVADVL